jgi:hypothetical protein
VLHKALLTTEPLPKPMGDVIDSRFGRKHSVPMLAGMCGLWLMGSTGLTVAERFSLLPLPPAAWLFDPLWVRWEHQWEENLTKPVRACAPTSCSSCTYFSLASFLQFTALLSLNALSPRLL